MRPPAELQRIPSTLHHYEGVLEALRGQTIVIKQGGSVGHSDTLPEDLALLQSRGIRVALVHGGGPAITAWLTRLGVESRFVRGLRVTDDDTLSVARMVLGGLVNGEIVARLSVAGCRAVGLSGSDDGLFQAHVVDPELGLVGQIRAVNPRPADLLINAGYAAVVAPLALDGRGRFLNVNADTAAGELAVALAAQRLVFFTDVPGIRDAHGQVVRRLTAGEARALIGNSVVDGGMIPKVEACLRGLTSMGRAQIVDGREPHALLEALDGTSGIGTVIVRE